MLETGCEGLGRVAHPLTGVRLPEAWSWSTSHGPRRAPDRQRHRGHQPRLRHRRPPSGRRSLPMTPADGMGTAADRARDRLRDVRPIDRTLDLKAVRAHIATVGVAAEVIDSRWSDYRFRLPGRRRRQHRRRWGRHRRAGALTDTVPLTPGHRYRPAVESLGEVSLAPEGCGATPPRQGRGSGRSARKVSQITAGKE